ncbi:signal recognition particle-docking protein FtsY [Ursidibacter maritimus]|uniref:Signal recognition particle receptor FtsY n=1 Tax=Ursidibacter maritimus TaxID=1331689 RepID=A0A949WFZ6_9PAST|nr:signal recognition particle-docking protein FtsY [Ursidibacter maritimus]KAE9540140.1 signal recognition particle-docking protein FtsY [Ursidibacter maritimus]MBV6523811.1 signal recognition particle-docking protein FtsY [Ursidibacter maritimus]MBV6526321.1 signal recognition particle-docking protein FtsY [Ursidibacter maritimus]MBV6527833.1 signal recognition particle-docking protein FtsY [Ursidibacter maritimus]MBV6529214.1 signal recognition particle-docking protein FtsY [Ursidibacter ma
MADEKKKKGFWSWLGFGKKEETETTPVTETEQSQEPQQAEPEENVELASSQAVTSSSEFAKESEEPTASDHLETSVLTQGVEHLTEKGEQLAEIAEGIEDVVDRAKEQVADKIEQVSDTIEKFEEQLAEQAETVLEVAQEKIEDFQQQAKTCIDEVKETNEDKVTEQQTEIELNAEQHTETENIPSEIDQTSSDETKISEIVNVSEEQAASDEYQEKPSSEGGFFSRLIKGLIKTKESIGSGFRNFFRGKKIDDELFDELEEQLLIADLGMPTTTKIINNLTQHASKQQLRDAELLYQQLKLELADVLKPVAKPLEISEKKPYVILMVGVNGVGKTTTIGKLARKFQAEGKSVMLAAGDTFRAAAVEQLQVWGERNHIPVVAQATGADSASVIFDAMQSAAAKGIDVLIADTAGRLQNKNNLMDELKKIVRVMKKYDETAPHEIMLTLDAGTGQNAISQAKLFNEAVGLTGITITKLDGTAKGGVIFAIADQFNIPIRFIGVGEKIDDLRPFNADEFIEALFSHEEEK